MTVAALQAKDKEILDFLLFNNYSKFNVNQTDDYSRHAIFYSVIKGDIESTEKLIQKESFLDMADNSGRTIVEYAIESNFKDIIELLVRQGIRVTG